MRRVRREESSRRNQTLLRDNKASEHHSIFQFGYEELVYPEKLLLSTGKQKKAMSVVLGPLEGNKFRARTFVGSWEDKDDSTPDFYDELSDQELSNAKVLIVSPLRSREDKEACERFLRESRAKMCSIATFVGSAEAKIDLKTIINAKNESDLSNAVKNPDYKIYKPRKCSIM
mmetsp:Transcript_11065/g.12663  ORF Transcript_11065/g.12663 Transcript_11065/m.12663 type:complete len:173 (-) Transcript_11065:2894-3412(-)